MIAFLKGRLVHKDPAHVVIDVQGVGYQVAISLQTYSEVKDQEQIFLYTHLQIREDAHVLFGFSRESEKKLFQQLISVSGVGPSTAIVMLSYMSSNELKTAIVRVLKDEGYVDCPRQQRRKVWMPSLKNREIPLPWKIW